MINLKIKETLDSILPDEIEKKTMLENILKKKKTNHKPLILLVPTFAIIIICLSIFNKNPIQETSLIKKANIGPETINFLGRCYQENGIYEGTDLIEVDTKLVEGGRVFRVKDNNIVVILKDNVYLKYEICKKEGN